MHTRGLLHFVVLLSTLVTALAFPQSPESGLSQSSNESSASYPETSPQEQQCLNTVYNSLNSSANTLGGRSVCLLKCYFEALVCGSACCAAIIAGQVELLPVVCHACSGFALGGCLECIRHEEHVLQDEVRALQGDICAALSSNPTDLACYLNAANETLTCPVGKIAPLMPADESEAVDESETTF